MGGITSLAFSPDGNLLVTGGSSFDDAARSWYGVRHMGRLATGPGRLKVWDVKTGDLKYDLDGHSYVEDVVLSPNGSLLASVGRWSSGNEDGTGLILWNALTGKKERQISVRTNGGAHSVAFSPDSTFAAIISMEFDKDKDRDAATSSVTLIRTGSGIVEWTHVIPGTAKPVAFSPDGKNVLVLCDGKSLQFLDTNTGKMLKVARVHDQGSEWTDFAVAPQARSMATGGSDRCQTQRVCKSWNQAAAFPGDPDPDKAVQLTTEGWQLWNAGRMDTATAKFQEALKLDPQNTNAQNGLGWALWKNGKTKEAIDAFETLLKTEPKHPGISTDWGNSIWHSAITTKRRNACSKPHPAPLPLGTAWPSSISSKKNLLTPRTGPKRSSPAVTTKESHCSMPPKQKKLSPELRQIIEPGNADLGQAWQLMNQGHRAEAKKIFDELLAKSVDNASVLNGLGWYHLYGNELNEAKPFFERALKADPNATGSMNGLARILKSQGQTEEAIQLWETLVQKVPA